MSKLLLVGNSLDFTNEIYTVDQLVREKATIVESARKQLINGVGYLNIRVGDRPEDKEVLKWLVKTVQLELRNCPLFLDSLNREVIASGLEVYNREQGKPFINSADYGKRENYLDLAAEYDTKVVCVCMRNEVPMDEKERLDYCNYMLDKGIKLGINPNDMFFNPVSVSIVENQDKLVEVLDTIRQINQLKLKTICDLERVTGWVYNEIKPFIESAFINMALINGLDAAIIDPQMKLLMTNILAGENILNKRLFSQGEWISMLDELKEKRENFK